MYRSKAVFFSLLLGLGLAGAGCSSRQPQADTAPQAAESAAAEAPAAQLDPQSQRRFQTGLQALRAKHYQRAQREFGKLAEGGARAAGVYVNLGIAHYRLQAAEPAIEAFEKALELDPKQVVAANYLGILYRKSGKFQQAREAYQRALRAQPDYAYAHLNLGILYDLYLLQTDKALEHYRRYQELSPAEDKQVKLWITDLQRRTQRAR